MPKIPSLRRTFSVARKEVLHILRDRATLFFAMFLPIVEMFMLGYAIDTNVRDIRTVVLDQCRTQESRTLIQRFVNSKDFKIIGQVSSDAELHEAIVAGRALVGIKIPENYSHRVQGGDTAQILVLVDGSESRVAAEAVNVGNALALRDSLRQMIGDRPLPVESHPRILFNPDTRSANYFIPGLWVVLPQVMATILTATSIVREKENGTLEQLFMTPVRAGELMIGKLTPYLFLTFVELCGIGFLMNTAFAVPIHGNFLTLLALAFPFVLTMLGVGLWISTRAATRDAAMQLTTATIMPSVFLSGYVFPLDSMPPFFYRLAQLVPTTWLIDAARGVILRGAGWAELWPHALVLWGMAIGILGLSTLKFRKRL